MRTFRILLAGALAALGLNVLVTGSAGAASPASLSLFQQCQLQTAPYQECSGWTNGSLNQSNHYAEDMVVPQRAQFAASAGTDYVFSITYDFADGARHGYDYLATWNASVGVDPCKGTSASLCSGVASQAAMAADASLGTHTTGIDRKWTLYGATFVSDTAPVYSGKQATVTVTFHATTSSVVLLFGGHLAVGTPASAPRSWGNGNGAHDYPGASLSIRQTGASRNNGINTSAIAPLPAAAFTIAKTANPTTAAPGAQVTYAVTVTNTGGLPGSVTFTDDYDNGLTNVTTPTGCTQGSGAMTCTATNLAAGASRTFTYTANLPRTFTSAGTGCGTGLFAVKNTATLASGTNVTAGTTGSASATVCVNAAASFSVVKTPRSTTAAAGGNVVYDVVVTNNGSAPGSTSFTDNYDDRASVVGTLPTGCTDTTSGTDKKFTCTTNSIAGGGGTQTFTYTIKMPATFTGTPSGCDNGGYPVVNHVTGLAGTSDATVCVTTSTSFSVVKTPRSSTAVAGGNVIYDVVVTNNGTGPGSTSFTDNYDDRASVVGTLPTGCSDTTSGTDKKFTCTTAVIDPGQSQTFTYTIKMPPSFTGTPSGCDNGGYPVVNHVTGAAGTSDATVCVTASPSFSVVKTPRSTTAAAGGNVIYDVVVTNNGTGPGSTSFTDNYDDRASVVGTLPEGCTDATSGTDKKFTCDTAVINPGQTQTFTYTIKMPATFTGSPTLTCLNGGYAVVNHVTGAAGTSDATVCVTASPSFSITKTASSPTAAANGVVGYTVTVTNNGSGPGTATFTDDYNDNATAITPLADGCVDSTSGTNKKFTCTTGVIDPGQNQVFTYDIRMPATFTGTPSGCDNGGYPVVNTVTLTSGGTPGTVTVCVDASPAFTVVKTARSSTAAAGANVVYDVVVTNNGSAPGSTSFTDNYDDRASVVGTLPTGCTDSTSGTDKKFTCTTGSIAAGGGTKTFTYTIKMPSSFTGTPTGCDNGGYPVVNTVSITGSSSDPETVCVTAPPQLGIAKTGSIDFDDNGDQIISYTISYTNTGAGQANGVTITDQLPAGTAFVNCDGCTTGGSPTTATWNIGAVAPVDGSGSVHLTLRVTTNQTCSISNTAQIRIGGAVAATSDPAVVNVTPVPDTANAKSNGSAIGVQVKTKGVLQLAVGLVNAVVTGSGNSQALLIGQTSSSQSGPGGPTTDAASLVSLNLTGIISTGIIRETSASVVTKTPAETRQTSTSEVASVCLVPVAGVCTVKSDTVRAVASTTATGSYAGTSAAGSTIENLYINNTLVPVDLSQTTQIPLSAAIFGRGSYVAINERTSSSGLVNGTYVADMNVAMIHVKITNLALIGALDVVVAQATAHSEFPKTLVCSGGTHNQSVSGHAYVGKLFTGPLLADLMLGYVQISPLGGTDSQHVAGAVIPSTGVAVNAQVADTTSTGGFDATSSTARSWAEVAGDATKPACVLSYVTDCVLKATLIRSEARSAATAAGSTSNDVGTSFVGLRVLGIPINGSVDPNTTIPLAGIGFVILNEQFCDNGVAATHTCSGAGHSGITVRAARVVITVANNILKLNPGVELIVSEAHADSTFS